MGDDDYIRNVELPLLNKQLDYVTIYQLNYDV
jgi:hypothetical protein